MVLDLQDTSTAPHHSREVPSAQYTDQALGWEPGSGITSGLPQAVCPVVAACTSHLTGCH
jgi:hypothetical protein